MKNKAIYFVEINGEKNYKTDTFWSKSLNIKMAKIHSDDQNDQDRFLKSLIQSFSSFYTPSANDQEKSKRELFQSKYEGGIYGYQIIDVVKDGEFITIGNPVYLKVLYNINSLPDLDGSYSRCSVDTMDYKIVQREEKINKILNK